MVRVMYSTYVSTIWYLEASAILMGCVVSCTRLRLRLVRILKSSIIGQFQVLQFAGVGLSLTTPSSSLTWSDLTVEGLPIS